MTPDELKDARTTLGLTQDELAAKLGLNSGRAVRAYENGERRISQLVANYIEILLHQHERKK